MPTPPTPLAPGPDGPMMLRKLPLILGDTLGFLRWCTEAYGHVVAFPLPSLPVLLVDDPAAARHILVDNHRNWDKGTIQYRTLGLVTGEGLLTSDGETWRRSRRLAQPAFHHGTVERTAEHTVTAGRALTRRWEGLPHGTRVDVAEDMMATTLEVFGASLFGADHGADGDRLVRAVLRALDVVVRRARSPVTAPAAVPTPGNLRLRRALATLDASVASILSQHAARPRGDRADLLSMLLGARDGSAGLTPRQVRDEIVTLVIAGHETVASSLTWTWHLLATHPEAEARLHAELDAVLGGRPPRFADLPHLRVTRQVVEESLRLYPPAWVITRRSLGPDEVAGLAVPAGTLVLISPYVLHRHPGWWADPDAFRPERFAGGAEDAIRQAYLPFGAGPRLCIGRDFALLEATLLLATLAQRFTLTPAGLRPPRLLAQVTIQPRGGLPMHVRRRTAATARAA